MLSREKILEIFKETNVMLEGHFLLTSGRHSDKLLPIAFNYLEYLGTSKFTPEDIKKEYFKMACSFGVGAEDERVFVVLRGLNDNIEKALELMENLLADPQANQTAFTNLIADIKKERADAQFNQNAIFTALQNYAIYGKENPYTYKLSNAELDKLTPEILINKIKEMKKYQHKV